MEKDVIKKKILEDVDPELQEEKDQAEKKRPRAGGVGVFGTDSGGYVVVQYINRNFHGAGQFHVSDAA